MSERISRVRDASASESGMSLVSVLIASGIMGTVILGLTSMMTFTHRTVQSTTALSDFNSLVTSLQGVLNHSTNCKAVLGVFTLDPAGAYPQAVSPLRSNGSTGAVIAQTGRFGGSLDITKLEFTTPPSPLGATNQYLATLHLEAKKVVGGGAVGGETMKHDFQLAVTIDSTTTPANKITGCSGQTDTIWKRIGSTSDIHYSEGRVGIGTTSPDSLLNVFAENHATISTTIETSSNLFRTNGFQATVYSPSEFGPMLWLRKARGTPAVPELPRAGDRLGEIMGAGWNANLTFPFRDGASIMFEASHDWTAIRKGSQIRFFTADHNTGNGYDRMTIEHNGDVSIGRVPLNTVELRVHGNIRASGCVSASSGVVGGTCTSDARLKTDVRPFRLGLNTLLGISPRTFKYNGHGGIPASDQPELGVIADELEKAAPSLVSTRVAKLHPEDAEPSEIKQVNYTAFTYVLMNAVKDFYRRWFADSRELHRELGALKAENAEIKARLEKLERTLEEKR